MSFLELGGIDDVKELPIAAEGEYELVISKADGETKDNGVYQIRCMIEIQGDEKYAPIFHYLTMPGGDDDDEKRGFKLLFIKRFLTLFDITVDGGFDEESLVGARGLCNVTQDEYEGNTTNKIQLPRLS